VGQLLLAKVMSGFGFLYMSLIRRRMLILGGFGQSQLVLDKLCSAQMDWRCVGGCVDSSPANGEECYVVEGGN
jgi:hypothetical protein